jgi:hypothetical protein
MVNPTPGSTAGFGVSAPTQHVANAKIAQTTIVRFIAFSLKNDLFFYLLDESKKERFRKMFVTM